MTGVLNLNYTPGGPVLAAFMRSRAAVQAIMGPIGSGKTQGCAMKFVRLAAAQRRSTLDGRRKFKLCVVRDTYRQLWKTTIPSWWKRVPKELGDWVGADGDPAQHRITFALPDGSEVEFTVEFIAIGENAVEDVLRGYEPTAFWLNEGDLLARSVFTYARSRVGRYPEMSEGGPSWYGVVIDFNAPDTENYLYEILVEDRPADFEFFVQPGGNEPGAENLQNLPAGYYDAQVAGQPDWWIRRFIRNEFGYSRDGKPVYPEFNDKRHVAPAELPALAGIPLLVGLDAGGTPAAILGQRLPNGQWRIVDELVSEQGTGPKRFGESLARLFHDRYPHIRTIRGIADPSAAYGADTKAGESTWIEIVAAAAGIRIEAAPTNKLTPRLEAVRAPLTRLIDGEPGFLLSPNCKVLRKGFNAGYRYRRIQLPGADRYTDEPEKNEWSHPHDAQQYLLSGGGEDLEIADRKQNQQRARQAQGASDWDPFSL